MFTYEKVIDAVKKKYNWNDAELREAIDKAKLWHNPLNYDDGQEFKDRYGWKVLFNEGLKKDGHGKRYYFRFHDYDMTDADIVINAFRSCKNWKKYLDTWQEYAPVGLKYEGIYLLAVTEMSTIGFNHEKREADRLRAEGHKVVVSTYEEDKAGVDLWVDGKPVQIKSPATARIMKIKGV